MKEFATEVVALKSAFVKYDSAKIPPYDGMIGKSTCVTCCRIATPLIPITEESVAPLPEIEIKRKDVEYAVLSNGFVL